MNEDEEVEGGGGVRVRKERGRSEKGEQRRGEI